jgi:hypothetical protein
MTSGVGVALGRATWLTGSADRVARALKPTVIDPFLVRFSQDSARSTFKRGGTIQDMADGLRNGSLNADKILPIRLVERSGTLFTLDNRRLEAFRRAETNVPFRMATPQETADEAWKFSTKNDGISIRIKGE